MKSLKHETWIPVGMTLFAFFPTFILIVEVSKIIEAGLLPQIAAIAAVLLNFYVAWFMFRFAKKDTVYNKVRFVASWFFEFALLAVVAFGADYPKGGIVSILSALGVFIADTLE